MSNTFYGIDRQIIVAVVEALHKYCVERSCDDCVFYSDRHISCPEQFSLEEFDIENFSEMLRSVEILTEVDAL